MIPGDIPATRLTLIGRLSDPNDRAAWDEFVARYGSVLRRWCRGWGLQEADAEDVVQNILLELVNHVHQYESGGRFRGWLRTVARRAWYDYAVKRADRDKASGNSEVLRILDSVEAREDFLAQVEAEADVELLDIAMERVREMVSENAWQSFHLLTLKQLSGEEVAERLGIRSGSAYVANCKVKKLLQEEVERLNGDDLDLPAPPED